MSGKGLFIFSVLVGVYSYSIFLLGVLHVLTAQYVGVLSIIFLGAVGILFKNIAEKLHIMRPSRYWLLFLPFVFVNAIGALGPELAFDALWYHLTIPKFFIEREAIEFIPGGLLYYSAMPKLIDLTYIPILMFSNEIGAKLLSFVFGLLVAGVTYIIARQFVSQRLAVMAALIFYTNLVVSWLSITAYIDLPRAFFTATGLYFLLLYIQKTKKVYLVFSAVVIGLEITTKLLGVGTLVIALVTILLMSGLTLRRRLLAIAAFALIALSVVSPWLIFSFLETGSPIYPFFSSIYPSTTELSVNPLILVKDAVWLFLFSPDPISPLYAMALPLVIMTFRKYSKEAKVLVFMLVIVLIIWMLTPQKNARFITAYLPIFSVLVVYAWFRVKSPVMRNVFFVVGVVAVITSLLYRVAANARYIPVIIGVESKEEFLINNLNFNFGDYIDRDRRVAEIVDGNRVKVYGIHNLYYVDFPYDHESWADDTEYRYILTRGMDDFGSNYTIIYSDPVTDTHLYEYN